MVYQYFTQQEFNQNSTPSLPQRYLILTSPLCYLNLTFTPSGISNHDLETTLYITMDLVAVFNVKRGNGTPLELWGVY